MTTSASARVVWAALGLVLAASALHAQARPAAPARGPARAAAQAAVDTATINAAVARVAPAIIEVRHYLHQHPELGNRETRTAGIVAEHLRKLGLEVRTGVGVTGVVGVLKGGRPGKAVALRADMDALPVTEQVALPFASKIGRAHV